MGEVMVKKTTDHIWWYSSRRVCRRWADDGHDAIQCVQSGVFEAERIIKEEPDYFTDQEIQDLVASETVLGKAPDIIEEYKRKLREFERLHDMVLTVVQKCENIVDGFEERQAYNTEGSKIKKEPTLDVGMIRYTADGEIIVKKDKKVIIELPKHDEYD